MKVLPFSKRWEAAGKGQVVPHSLVYKLDHLPELLALCITMISALLSALCLRDAPSAIPPNPVTMPAATLVLCKELKSNCETGEAWKTQCRQPGLWGVEESGFKLQPRKLQEMVAVFWQTYCRTQCRRVCCVRGWCWYKYPKVQFTVIANSVG